ncbi:MAG: SDR family oxidoreductase [Actinomycetota bacterium]|uniref:SDR family oxidoreductase n=1 Tax=Mycobacterium lentiflavum TaxID=141349 RepID=A0ABY3UPK9_MYCLN|nr:SDR family oxidoreductase [Mycobacterium lentiflavum]MEE3062439.1 SDR family oxidoreductase [Actinomycetota bacterium]ULP40337.1 SDR family oxidoreductase [Mycobacterium lentiflavum]
MSVLTDCLSPRLLAGTAAFITGGGSGINLAIAHAFAEVGADVAICGRSEERLERAAQELRALGGRVATAVADVRDPEAMNAAISHAAEKIGPLSTIIAGAAGNFLAPAHDMSSKGFRTVIDIDLLGSFHTARSAFDQLRTTRGNIQFISAGQSDNAYLHQAHVGAAKAGIDSLMRHLAAEWGPYGIRSNALVPGPIGGTEGMKRLAAHIGEQPWTDGIALGRFGTPGEVAAMAVVLASPLASFVTGARIAIDGGLALAGSGLVNRALVQAGTVNGQISDGAYSSPRPQVHP